MLSSTAIILERHSEEKEEVISLAEALNFTRYNVHIEGTKEDVQRNIEKATNLIDSTKETNNAALTKLCKQVGIYYLFYLRDEEKAVKYFEKFRNMSTKETEDYADANLFMGYAKTITGTYKNPSEITTALNFYIAPGKLENQNQDLEISLKKAIAYCFLGLMYHRNAIYTDNNGDKQNYAKLSIAQLDQALKIQKPLLAIFPNAAIEIANTLHIMGAVYVEIKDFERGLDFLQQSARHSQTFCDITGYEHFMKFITMQTIAALWINLPSSNQKNYQDASDILDKAYTGQCKLYGTEKHADIAKTLHFHGEALNKLNLPESALKKFETSLEIKKKFFSANDKIREKTQLEVDKLKVILASVSTVANADQVQRQSPAPR